MKADLNISSRLLDIIARKLGHDYLLLMSRSEFCEAKWCNAVFGQYENYSDAVLEADGRQVQLKRADNEDMYAELVRLLYKTLENGGNVSDGKSEVYASDVPEFMIECVLNGVAE